MEILSENWLTDSPFDYELKRYKLLAAVKKLTVMIEEGNLYSSLIEVEKQLNDLYKLKHKKSEIDNSLRILKGINLDTMSLEYEYPEENETIAHMYALCDIAIQNFEDLFKLIRNKWRLLSKKIDITEIPSSRPTKTKGYVFVKNNIEEDIITYSYNKPSKIIGEWKDMILTKEHIKIKSTKDISDFIHDIDSKSNEYRFLRCDHSIKYDYDDCVLPLVKYNIFYKINVS